MLSDPTARESSSARNDTHHIIPLIDYICLIAHKIKIFYLWRPFLKDPRDDMVLELAVTANCDTIVTFNKRDFGDVDEFGIMVLTPQEFLKEIGEL